MSNIVYGICGKSRHGKDTFSDYLVDNYNWKKIPIADSLKEACSCIFGFDKDQLYGYKKEDVDEFWECTPRKTLQYVGTELFREKIGEIMPNIGKDIWIKSTIRKIKSHFEENPGIPVIISDIRFENEYKLLLESFKEFRLFKVYNPFIKEIPEVSCGKTHISEDTDWADKYYEFLFKNEGTLDDLYENIKNRLIL